MARPLPQRWLIIGAIALVAVVVAVAALLTAGDDVPADLTANAEATGTVQMPESGEPTGSAGPVGPAAEPVVPGVEGPDAPAGEPPAAGSQVAPAPGGAMAPPGAPAAPETALATITVPPSRTLSMIEGDRATPESRYDVSFDVYGFGPPGGAGSLVILVRTSSPVREVEKPYDFAGRNVLARLGPAGGDPVTVGGRYRGVITLKPNGSLLIPVLSDVRSGS